jgi:hypothetical protein
MAADFNCGDLRAAPPKNSRKNYRPLASGALYEACDEAPVNHRVESWNR